MVPLRVEARDWARSLEGSLHRTTALRHATLHDRPGLWGDHPTRPTSALWLRPGDSGSWEAFGAGRPEPSVAWLVARAEGKPIALLAPPSWEGPVRSIAVEVEVGSIQTRSRPISLGLPGSTSPVPVRRLTQDDRRFFEAAAPSWALRSWGGFAPMLAGGGVAIGVPGPEEGFASIAWTYESDLDHDKIGVATDPRFRNMGLGRASAGALVEEIGRSRRRSPLWVTSPIHPASIALAASLSFSIVEEEQLIRWTPPLLEE